MTDAELDALEAAAKAATPGPWETDYRQRYVFAENDVNVCEIRGYGELIHMVPECEAVEQMRSNGAFIAAANPAAVLDLIVELRQARADACEWIDMARWLAREMGGGVIPETQWLIIARQAVKEELDAAKEATCPKN